MKLFKFDYTKKDGSKSEREVMVLHSADSYVDGVDFTHLTEKEKTQVMSIQLQYELEMKPFMKKGFRRFLKEGMAITHEETIKKTLYRGETNEG